MILSNNVERIVAQLEGGLVVSCQARGDNPLHGPVHMAAMAEAAVMGGAVGIRADGVADVATIRERIDVPIIGINKFKRQDGDLFITPTCASARLVIEAGADLVAFDGTSRPRPGGESMESVIQCIHDQGALALADIATLEEGLRAAELGADLVGTTLSGYTSYSPYQEDPDLELVRQLGERCPVPVFAEGRYRTIEQVVQALNAGASFVVIGTAITNPMAITSRIVQGLVSADT